MSAPDENADLAVSAAACEVPKEEEGEVATTDLQQESVAQPEAVAQPIVEEVMEDVSRETVKQEENLEKAPPQATEEAPEEVPADDDVVEEEPDVVEVKADENDKNNSSISNGSDKVKEEEEQLYDESDITKEEKEEAVPVVKQEEERPTAQTDEVMEDIEPAETATTAPSQPPSRSASSDLSAPTTSKPTESEQREQHYSTRGRHASRETDQDIVHDRLGNIEEEAEPIGKGKTETSISFLDSLGEDERRTRTRFLPNVDGIHILYKAEVKQDLQLARTVMSSAGVSSILTAASRRSKSRSGGSGGGARRSDDENTELAEEDDDGTPSPTEEDGLSADSAGISDYTVMDNSAAVPSRAFVAPPSENGEGGDAGDGSKNNIVSSPHVVESVTAFNPPRPPESVGPKKKHRLVRWERRPQDVEGDLGSYRKTVYRTRSELENAQHERERIEAVSAHLRAHFLCQAQALNEEGALLSEELGSVQLECVKSADLLQSRTRSRGVGKGSYVMKDVLIILKQKGAETANLPVAYDGVTEGEATSGIGGISSKAFLDWERGNKVEPEKPASGWILPGNTVVTPYGKGTVMQVFGPTDLDVTTKPVAGSVMKLLAEKPSSAAPKRHGFGGAEPNNAKELMNGSGVLSDLAASESNDKESEKTSKNKKFKDKAVEDNRTETPLPAKLNQLLAPRVCVKLPFGLAFFPLNEVTVQEDVSSYSDSMLASRWQKMTESALSVAGCVDHAAMANRIIGAELSKVESDDMDVDDDFEHDAGKNGKDTTETKNISFLPYGSGLFPTAAGRAAILHDIPISALEKELNSQLLGNEGVLGVKGNTGVPEKFRAWEDIRDELSILRANVLQRRNALARQRRVRAINERAFAASRDKSVRVEHLVSEMRADLKSLKDRLDYELIELGIDGEKADCLLSAHYKAEDSKTDFTTTTSNVASPPKRQRREKERASPKQARPPRRRAEGQSTDDDLDESRVSGKRVRLNQ